MGTRWRVPTRLITKRLRLRPWTGDDADAALAIFGQREVARWLA
jgi:hypothetical protein